MRVRAAQRIAGRNAATCCNRKLHYSIFDKFCPQFETNKIKKNVPKHILAPSAVACDNLHLCASAHHRRVSAFLCNREFLGISYYIKICPGIMIIPGHFSHKRDSNNLESLFLFTIQLWTYIIQRVHIISTYSHTKMKMCTGRNTCRTYGCDCLTL